MLKKISIVALKIVYSNILMQQNEILYICFETQINGLASLNLIFLKNDFKKFKL